MSLFLAVDKFSYHLLKITRGDFKNPHHRELEFTFDVIAVGMFNRFRQNSPAYRASGGGG
jgi:hypothetical protein